MVLHYLRGLEGAGPTFDAADSSGRREGVRGFRRRHHRHRRSPDRGSAADEAVRRGDGRFELHLRRGLPQRELGRLDPGPRQLVHVFERNADVRGLRQPQSRRQQPRPLRSRPQSHLCRDGEPLRHRHSRRTAAAPKRQGEGRGRGANRPALDSGPAAQSALLFPGRAQRRHQDTRRRTQCVASAQAAPNCLPNSTNPS